MMENVVLNTINNFSQLIMQELARVYSESSFPRGDPDESDRIIKVGSDRVATLRQMRVDFEDAFAGR
jgi:hypothetical protein